VPSISRARVYLEAERVLDHLQLPGADVVVCSIRAPDSDAENQDAAGVVEVGDHAVTLVVADGVGGLPSAARAARIAVETVLAAEPHEVTEAALRAAAVDALENANQAVLEKAGAATVCVAQVWQNTLRPIHAGDCGILVTGQRGMHKHLSLAHGPVGYALAAGLIDEREAMFHPDRHEVQNCVGNAQMIIEVGPAVHLARRDTVVMASDGLLDNLFVAEIARCVRAGPLVPAAKALCALAEARMRHPTPDQPSKPDDLTFLLYRRRM
jgi:serine/threonine protein phosphatase PrpC